MNIYTVERIKKYVWRHANSRLDEYIAIPKDQVLIEGHVSYYFHRYFSYRIFMEDINEEYDIPLTTSFMFVLCPLILIPIICVLIFLGLQDHEEIILALGVVSYVIFLICALCIYLWVYFSKKYAEIFFDFHSTISYPTKQYLLDKYRSLSCCDKSCSPYSRWNTYIPDFIYVRRNFDEEYPIYYVEMDV